MFKARFLSKILILAILSISFLQITTVGYSFWNNLEETSSGSVGIGSWSTGIAITTAQEFYDFATKTDSTASDNYYLDNDIDFTGFSWVYDSAIANVVFYGTFSGNGHTISNLNITLDSTAYSYMGIFPNMQGGTITDLVLSNVYLSLGSTALAGTATSSGLLVGNITGLTNTIENITIINAGVRGTSVNGTGGLIGVISNAAAVVNIDNVKATGLKVFSTNSYVGGLVGNLSVAGATLNINDVDIQGEVSSMELSSYVGGIIGNIAASTNFSLDRAIIEITTQNTLETNSAYYLQYSQRYQGGIVGNNSGSSATVTINDAFFTGALIVREANRYNYVGTAIGNELGSSAITNSFYSQVLFSDNKGNLIYTVSRPKGIMLTVVNDSTMPSVAWWNAYSSTFLSANSLWAQNGTTGRLYLIR